MFLSVQKINVSTANVHTAILTNRHALFVNLSNVDVEIFSGVTLLGFIPAGASLEFGDIITKSQSGSKKIKIQNAALSITGEFYVYSYGGYN